MLNAMQSMVAGAVPCPRARIDAAACDALESRLTAAREMRDQYAAAAVHQLDA